MLVVYNYNRSTQNILETSQKFINLTNDSASSSIDDFLKPAGITKITAEMFDNKTLNIKSEELVDNLRIIMQTYPELASIYIIDAKGAMISELRANSDPSQNLFYIPENIPNTTLVTAISNETQSNVHWFYYDSNNNLLKQDIIESQFTDPRLQNFYQGALLNQDYWIGMSTSFNNNTGITVAYPIINNNQVLGVVAVDFNTSAIASFLSQLQNMLGSTVFIVNDQGQVLKASNDNQSNNIINAAIVNQSTTSQKVFSLNNIPYVSNLSSYSTNYNANWHIGIVLPLQTLIQNVIHTDKIMIEFASAMLMILILLILLCSRRLSRPMDHLTKETLKLKNLDFDNITQPKSSITEVNKISQALAQTKITLSQTTQYLPNTLVKKLLNNNHPLEISAQQQTLSFLSAQMDFKSLIESKDPNTAAEKISEDLEVISNIIHIEEGIIDQYQGQSLRALFGAPTNDGDYLKHACTAALLCISHLKDINIDIALHSGPAMIGNIGSDDQLHYIALGKNAELSTKLPSLNETYKTKIIATQAVYQAMQHQFLFRPINNVKINNENIMLYELINASHQNAPDEILATQDQIEMCTLTHQAFSAYKKQDQTTAIKLYQELLRRFPQDQLAKIILAIINEQQQM